ncbi:MAG: GIY-YIG nuclease family protein, partial [Dialister sp.]|nr:GIY-YIG nuclease family protein [Dialister sp.]
MVRCKDNSLYTGFTKGSAEKRVDTHNAGKG